MALNLKGHNTGAGSAVVAITNVTSGATLIVAWSQHTADSRTYTASSSVNGALTAVVTYAPSRRQGIFRLDLATAGDHTITLTANTGTTSVYAWVFEESLGCEAGAVIPTGDGVTDGTSVTTHYGAPVGEVDSASTASLDVVVVGTFGNTITAASPGTGYTAATVPSNTRNYCQYRSTTGPVTDDRGEFTNTGGANAAMATMALFQVKAGGGGAPASTWGSTMAWWFGL